MESVPVPLRELKVVDFTLPADPAFHAKLLKGNPVKNPEIGVITGRDGRREYVHMYLPVAKTHNLSI